MERSHLQEILTELNLRGSEASHVQTFSVWVRDREVRVELLDHGSEGGDNRFSAHAFWPDLPEGEREVNSKGLTIGNPGQSFGDALSNLHWQIFDVKK